MTIDFDLTPNVKCQMSDVISELLIVSISPQNLERGTLWFTENRDSIKRAFGIHPWWRDNTLFLEKDLAIRPAEILRRLTDFGYERSHTVSGQGLFAVRGGIIEVWPINTEKPYLIEFAGNIIETIKEREEKPAEVRLPFYRSRTSIEKLSPGSYVVHVDHGIGIFQGILKNTDQTLNSKSETLNKSQIQNSNVQNVINLENWNLDIVSNLGFRASDFFIIEYAAPALGKEPDRLYVPVTQKDRLSPYVGFETPRIHRLGGTIWQKTTRRIREDAQKMAQELMELYKKRAEAKRSPYMGDATMEKELRHTFAFTETPDQLRAEKEIMHDLSDQHPMDRILCGDVGFGKTEVALRAALRVITSGQQVALLAPTTVLAAQHEKTFNDRISDRLPITATMLSRLTSPRERKHILAGLKNGSIDCAIGTHRLLSSDIHFKNLGLVIIDEEQRFGVKQKEYFKNLRAEVDILSLSATPIPRTLSLALTKLRAISRLDTPPPDRLPIDTFILPYSEKTIARAIAHEIRRGGQIYFLHNRIETMDAIKEKIKNCLSDRHPKLHEGSRKDSSPAAQNDTLIGIIHGRMKEKEIIQIMNQFREKKINILIATTIIENGLDISSANTLIVDDATRLGLAQAHQLRGRIGRSATKAFAYFLYNSRHLTEKSAERLEALKEYSELGQGYEIALRDLEIRGAGNVLGREQSGAINKVGLNLYCQILSEAIEKQKAIS